MKLTPQQHNDLLVNLDKEAKDYTTKKKTDDWAHYFRVMKELKLLGYSTSEIGTKQACHYVPVPGKYEGCIPYKKGIRPRASEAIRYVRDWRTFFKTSSFVSDFTTTHAP